MRRIVLIWLPAFPIDRLRRDDRRKPQAERLNGLHDGIPFALSAKEGQRLVIAAANRPAVEAGIAPGMGVADALAILPSLNTHPAQPERDRRALHDLARWCVRYTPWANTDGADGLWLDITGTAHLFGGEVTMLRRITADLAKLGFTGSVGAAGTPGAAWALARYGPSGSVQKRIAPAGERLDTMLRDLPVEALRLDPQPAALLRRLGLRTIGDVLPIPRASLARRFQSSAQSESVLTRLDQALGLKGEPISPLGPPPVFEARRNFAEPCLAREGLPPILRALLDDLCAQMEREGQGARRITLTACHTDGRISRRRIGTARPSRDPDHLARLFRQPLESLDPDFGIDLFILSAERTEPLGPHQAVLENKTSTNEAELAQLIDRLSNRLGAHNIHWLAPLESHLPENAQTQRPADSDPPSTGWPDHMPPRPLRLLDRPEPIEAVAEVPDGPPLLFRWRRVLRRVARARGPERIAPEWWNASGPSARPRDYYDIEDTSGRRYWVFREGQYHETGDGPPPRWYLHGLFA